MKIKFKEVKDHGSTVSERIVLIVNDDDQLGNYMIFKAQRLNETRISTLGLVSYWFPDKEVKKNDLVVLYTTSGVNTERKNSDGTTTYFYYWGKDEPQWMSNKNVVVFTKLEEWQFANSVEPSADSL
jgi:hypothetical protein